MTSQSALSKHQDSIDVMKLDAICVCHSKPRVNERLLKCHGENGQNGKFFHLNCLDYKRMPNNSKTTWMCRSCKVAQTDKATTSRSTGPTTCTSTLNIRIAAASNSGVQLTQSAQPTKRELNPTATCDSSDDESEVEITGESTGNLDKTGALVALNDSHYEIINSPSGWLDCAIIQQAQILLKKANPLIESFQRTTLGPIRNFDIVTSEFIQILHTGHMHWVCVNSIGYTPGIVKLYDSLYRDSIAEEVTEQVKCLMADSYISLVNRELKIRRRRASTTVDLVEGGWGEVAVAMAGKHP